VNSREVQSMESKDQTHRYTHSHMWLVGVLGLAAGLMLMIYVPSLKAVSSVLILFACFHLIGGIVLLASFYVMGGSRIVRWWTRRRVGNGTAVATNYDFGWAPGFTMGPWIAALVAASVAVAIQVAAPTWWPLALIFVLLAASFFTGSLITRSFARPDHTALPMVDLLSGESDLVLDGGCGAGRTTIALGRVLKKGSIVALDLFDSDYIYGGGRELLERNLRLAALDDRVRIEHGDLTQLPFPDHTFDSSVSAHAIDHLGSQKENGLREMWRVLKPGGRFLLVVWVPGWAMFAVANVLSFFLTTKGGWKRMASRAGFKILDEGVFNGIWFLLLGKPAIDRGTGDQPV